MDKEIFIQPISKEDALKICEKIRKDYSGKWYTLAGLQCWGCKTFTGGDTGKMCFNSRSDYRGCNLVNAVFDKNR
ncbi:MAG: hypothetical protein FIA99_15570 [Ruminiclostridium sp.]|nr:hypothetical protein [Ruminiclostridium sp.]